MALVDIINQQIEKAGGIGKYYQDVSFESFVVYQMPVESKTVMRYDFTTRYLRQTSHIKTRVQLAAALGVSKSAITRRLQELGIEKKRVFKPYQNHIQECCLIINIENGIYYPNASEAARALNYTLRTVHDHMKSRGYYKRLIKVA